MYCPRCSQQAQEGQRFCKNCGTNLQTVSEAMNKGAASTSPFGFDFDKIKESLGVDVSVIKDGISWGEEAPQKREQAAAQRAARREARRLAADRKRWLDYAVAHSWQHNLKEGLASLLGGIGLGVFLYYMGHSAVESGALTQFLARRHWQIDGAEQLALLIWLVALMPVLKGLGQIIYAGFFAESMTALVERYTPPAIAPAAEETTQNFDEVPEPPPSVTEHTTRVFEDAPLRRETQ